MIGTLRGGVLAGSRGEQVTASLLQAEGAAGEHARAWVKLGGG